MTCLETMPSRPSSAHALNRLDGEALERFGHPEPNVRVPTAHGGLAALATAFYKSPGYLNLAPASQSIYRRVLDAFLEAHGHRQVSQMRREHVIAIIGGMADRPGAANMLLKRLRTLLRFGLDIGWLTIDPTYRIRAYGSRELHTWTENELKQFEATWPNWVKATARVLAAALYWSAGI
jgi:hypothetical protein